MSRAILKDISELTDSREVLTERPHKFVSIFAYILIALLIAALIWSIVGEIDVYVRAHGEVRPNDTISTVRSTFSGRVLEANIEDGMTVQRGDILFSVNAQEHLDTLGILERQYATISNEIENLALFRESIILGENLFDHDNANQADYYFRFRQYVTSIESAVEQLANTNLDIERFYADAESTRDSASIAHGRAESELSAFELLYESIVQGRNLVPSRYTQQHRFFIDYEINIQRFASAISSGRAALDRMEQLYAVGGVSRSDRDSARFELDAIILERDSFISETRLSVLQGVSGLEWNIIEFDAALLSADSMLEIPGGGFSEELLRERHMLDTLTSIADSRFSLQNNLETLQIDITGLRQAIEDATVVAPIDGVVSMFGEMNVGDFIQTGMDIATILPVSGGEHRVMLFVSNADIAGIEEGQRINFRFAALPFADFGEMPGRVTRISTDAHSSEDGQSFFIVEAEMDSGSLFDRNGIEAEVRVGMVCDARVITNTQRIIHWVLERLDFMN